MLSFMSTLQLNINNFSSSRKEVWLSCEMVTAAMLTDHMRYTASNFRKQALPQSPHRGIKRKKATYGLCFDTERKLQGN